MVNKLTNKPVTPGEEMLELLKEWTGPDVTEVKSAELKGKTNFLGVSIADMYNKKPQVEEVEEEVPQLTAEEIEQIRQEAYNEGFAQGKEEGHAKGHEEGLEAGFAEGKEQGHLEGKEQGLHEGQVLIQQQVEHWQQLVHQLYNPIERVDRAAEMQLLDLAVMLSESVIRSEIKSNRDSLLQVLHEAAASLPFNTEYAEMHLHPDDVELIQSVYDEEELAERKWILKPEPGYQIGDLIVGTPNSLIDRTVKHRIKQTLQSFIESVGLDKEQIESPVPLSPTEPQSQLSPTESETVETSEPEALTTDAELGEEAISEPSDEQVIEADAEMDTPTDSEEKPE